MVVVRDLSPLYRNDDLTDAPLRADPQCWYAVSPFRTTCVTFSCSFFNRLLLRCSLLAGNQYLIDDLSSETVMSYAIAHLGVQHVIVRFLLAHDLPTPRSSAFHLRQRSCSDYRSQVILHRSWVTPDAGP